MSLQLIPGPDGGGGDGVGEGHQLLLPLPSQTPSCAQLSLDARAASSSGQSLHHTAYTAAQPRGGWWGGTSYIVFSLVL